MKILLADKQDITRAGLSYVISKMEGLETQTIEDKAELMLALRENEDTVVILDYTLFDINDAAELLILNQRFPYTRWLLFSEDLSADFVKILIASSTQFSVLLKECSLMEIKEAIRFCVASNRFVCQRMMEVLLAPKQEEQEKINLTKTETEILKDIALGMTTKEIAEKRFSSSSVSFPKSLIVFTMVSLRLTSSFRRSYCCAISPILTSSSAPVFSFLYREMKGMVQPSSSKEMVFSTAFLERFSSLEIRSMISVIRLFAICLTSLRDARGRRWLASKDLNLLPQSSFFSVSKIQRKWQRNT